jgi:hypothetical protein
MNATYQHARLYMHHCGFSVAPMWFRQKSMLFNATAFAQRPPTPEHLRQWFTGQARNIAVIPGAISDNLVIVDFDDFGAWQVFHALTGFAGPVVRTARGVHVYARCAEMPARNGQGFFEDLHVGQIIVNGNITAPPSVHPSGWVYQWHGSPQRVPYLRSLADIGIERRDVATAVTAAPRPLPRPACRGAWAAGIRDPRAYALAALRRECDQILNALAGHRNNQLYRAALKVAKYADVIPTEQLAEHLARAATRAGLDQAEIRGTIRSGFTRAAE